MVAPKNADRTHFRLNHRKTKFAPAKSATEIEIALIEKTVQPAVPKESEARPPKTPRQPTLSIGNIVDSGKPRGGSRSHKEEAFGSPGRAYAVLWYCAGFSGDSDSTLRQLDPDPRNAQRSALTDIVALAEDRDIF